MFKLPFGRVFPFCSDVKSGSNGEFFYSGPYHDGKAAYHYYKSGDVRVYSGEFVFTRSYYNYPQGKTSEKTKGHFLDDKKEGRWEYRVRKRKMKRTLAVDYTKGCQNGLYSYRSVCRSRTIDMWNGETSLSVSMNNGHPVGKIEGHFDKEIFYGYFDDDGCPDGKWMLDMSRTSSHLIEYEVWSHGRLQDTYSIDMSTGARKKSQIHLLEFIMNFIYSECRPLESFIKKGSEVWNGDIRYDK